MKIFALSDLHLSLARPRRAGDTAPPVLYKPMDRFGLLWADYFARLESSWLAQVGPQDAVLIAGDISWAMTLEQAQPDLDYIASLPGRKLLIKGNHDYWWQSLSRVRQALDPSVQVLQHGAADLGPALVCGTRGWLTPCHGEWRESEDRRLLERELLRLGMALEEAVSLDPQGGRPLIAMLHYPPLDEKGRPSPFCRLLEQYRVSHCLYGHIHGDKKPAFEGLLHGVEYHNCSIDRLNFQPKRIM